MIRAIIFDCFGVLYHGSISHLYQLIPTNKHAAFNDLRKQADYGYITNKEYLSETSKLTGLPVMELKQLIDSDHIRNDAMVEYVREQKNIFKTALLSNVGSRVMDQLFTPGERAEMFDATVLSCDVGMTKPSVEIYQLTAQKLGVLPEECLMVDDLEVNISGAVLAGMQGVVYDTVEQVRESISIQIQEST